MRDHELPTLFSGISYKSCFCSDHFGWFRGYGRGHNDDVDHHHHHHHHYYHDFVDHHDLTFVDHHDRPVHDYYDRPVHDHYDPSASDRAFVGHGSLLGATGG
jgi:hypothetical protein